MEKLVAKIAMGHDIAHMYSNENRPGTCPICHNTIEKTPDPLYKVSKKKGDIFYTYDGFCIVSENFKSFCDERAYPHLTFVPFTKSVGYLRRDPGVKKKWNTSQEIFHLLKMFAYPI
jgi:hypothetical protein